MHFSLEEIDSVVGADGKGFLKAIFEVHLFKVIDYDFMEFLPDTPASRF